MTVTEIDCGVPMIDESEFHDIDEYFAFQVTDNDKFWLRLGGRPDFAGQHVLDFGCGHGALSLDVARAGAASVLGIDLSEQRIRYAIDKVAPLAPNGTLSFGCIDITTMKGEARFDRIVSKDTLEHVAPLDAVLASMIRLLKPGGELIFGFSPLYYSPFGDHGELGSSLPWAHLFAGERRVLAAFNRKNRSDFNSLPDAGFNMRKRRDFLEAFQEANCDIRYLAINPSVNEGLKSSVMALLRTLARFRPLEPFMTIGIYTILSKKI
jgi:ubiquinone/menaquinone biosynthesis C-methylase UbiE